jgi:uncharacterized protein YtpQ (UPF0354 family)
MLQFVAGIVGSGAGWGRTATAQNSQFRDSDRTRDKIVAMVRSFPDSKSVRPIQKIEPAVVTIPEMKVRPDDLPLVDYFVGDLQLRYSFDDPKHVSSVSLGDLKRLKLTREELLPLSVANFRRLYPKFKVERLQAHLASVTDAGELEPSLMLDAKFWDQERERAGSDILAAVPARDALIFSNRAVTRNVDVLKGVATEVYEKAGRSALSKRIYLWNQGRWEVFG